MSFSVSVPLTKPRSGAMSNDTELLNVGEAALALGCSGPTVRR